VADDAELRAAWSEHVDASARGLGELEELIGRHREAHRRYHGLRHVTWVVRHVRELAQVEPVVDLDAVIAAAFFHDAVYDPAAHDNEEQSARLAERVLVDLGWEAPRAAGVGELVEATAGHEPSADSDRSVLLDADLAVLGSDPAAYQAYATGVRVEYMHLDDEQWRTGRVSVLEHFLSAPAIYATATARTRWESRARANLTAELIGLRR
jgi:predicted metal-dependent HD superfamily phosphohydrolase